MNSLKLKFGKFAISQKEMIIVLGGRVNECTDMFKCGASGGGGGDITCFYSSLKGHNAGEQRSQGGFNQQQADAFAALMRNLGFQVACH